jgi:hypothetical protein
MVFLFSDETEENAKFKVAAATYSHLSSEASFMF